MREKPKVMQSSMAALQPIITPEYEMNSGLKSSDVGLTSVLGTETELSFS